MDGFKDGLYEKVISQRLGQRLQEALDQKKIWATISDKVDPQEAVGYLSDYIRKLVHLCLKDLADQNGESLLQQELALTNGLIRCLSEKLPALGTDNQVNREDFLLLELQHRINQIQEVHRPHFSLPTVKRIFPWYRNSAEKLLPVTESIFWFLSSNFPVLP